MVSTSYEPVLSPRAYSQPDGAPVVDAFPRLEFGAMPVSAKSSRHSSTGLYTTLAWVLFIAGGLMLTAMTYGVALLFFLLGPVIDWFRHKKVRAMIHGSGVKVSADQLPELHALVEAFSRRLALPHAPDVFIVEDSVQNGVVMKLGTKNILLLTDDVVWGALKSNEPRTLAFAVGHELAHIALGHTGTLRAIFRNIFRPLARVDEHSADAVATALVGDAKLAVRGLASLTVGPQLVPYLNEDALIRQAREVWADRNAKKVERQRTHPLLLRRVAYVLGAR